MKLMLKTYRCGSPRKRGEGIRVGTVRFPPRGVKKVDYKKKDYFDIWFPTVAPSRTLRKKVKKWNFDEKTLHDKFLDLYEKELKKDTDARQSVMLLAEIAKKSPISVGCYCKNEQRCHRSRLIKVIEKAAHGKWGK